jgi:hypothetical protein
MLDAINDIGVGGQTGADSDAMETRANCVG